MTEENETKVTYIDDEDYPTLEEQEETAKPIPLSARVEYYLKAIPPAVFALYFIAKMFGVTPELSAAEAISLVTPEAVEALLSVSSLILVVFLRNGAKPGE